MFEISLEQKNYPTYLLSDRDNNSTVELVPERGGIVTLWHYQDKEIFYLDTERYLDPTKSVRGGIPILFPICGNLVDDAYTYKGKQYNLKQHGFARNLPWEVVEQDTANQASITLMLKSNDETLAVYPFEFELTFTYQLKGNTFKIIQRHTNKSDAEMPFSTGFHPYFFVEDKSQLTFDIPASQQIEKGSGKTSPFTGTFDFSQEEVDNTLFDLTGNSASFTDNKKGITVTQNYSPEYTALVFWTLQGKDFICVEPWSAQRNSLNTGEDMINLAPGETKETWVEIVVS